MAAIVSFLVVIYFVVNCCCCVATEMTCPAQCSCDLWLGLRRTRCQGRHLYSVDTGAPRETQALDLPGNSISVIGNREIADIGLTQLKYLNLSDNAISEIALDAFAGLKELTVLDLSRNRLRSLLQEVFLGNDKLRVLRLSGNYFGTDVPKLESPSITDLSLDSCQIDHLPVDTFQGMPQIRSLDLSENQMIQLDVGVLESLGNLRKISLEGNPWSCNNAIRELGDFLAIRNVDFREICPQFSGVRKFEKIVVAPNIGKKTRKKIPARVSNTTITSKDFSDFSTTTQKPREGGRDFPEKLTDRWIFFGGFACGIVVGITVNSICLAICLCRKKRRRRRNDPQRVSLLGNFWSENLRGNSQENNWQNCRGRRENSQRRFSENRRAAREANLWEIFQGNRRPRNTPDSSFPENVESVFLPCPGTPPPAYREVMLRPALYRSPTTSRPRDSS